jgi:predicted ArsR family transcriptional regulator
MTTDVVAENASWLDDVFAHPENRELFDDEDRLAIQGELSNRWVQEDRLELLNELEDRFGEAAVLAVIDKIIDFNCRRDWGQVGREKGNSLENFIRLLWEPLQESGFEYSFEKEGNSTKFRVTKCPMYKLAQEIGAEKWFYHLLCLTDGPAAEGFNNRIRFSRTRTLMQGYADCDHCYTELSS